MYKRIANLSYKDVFYNYYIILNGSNQDLKYGSHKVKITNKKYSREEIWVRMSSEGELFQWSTSERGESDRWLMCFITAQNQTWGLKEVVQD